MSDPVVAQSSPYAVELEDGKTYFWCACGRSENQPFCDGSHSRENTGIDPVRFECSESKTYYMCGCKATGKQPMCDGTHATLD